MQLDTIAPFLDYFDKIRARTERVLDCVPPERSGWAPAPGRFSFADITRHLGAMERYMFAENAHGRPSAYPGHGPELADGWQAARDFLRRMHQETLDLLGRLTPDALARKCATPAGVEITVWKWLRAMVEHEVHHRGQIYLMLGLLGVETPPLYGLTAEQVEARSRPRERVD